MKSFFKYICVSLLVFFVIPPSIANAQETKRIILKFRPLVPNSIQNNISAQNATEEAQDLKSPRTKVITVPSHVADRLVKKYNKHLLIEFAEEDYEAFAMETPSDNRFSDQWSLQTIKAPQAWEVTHGKDGVEVAIIDSGIDSTHDDLQGKIIQAQNFTSDKTEQDEYGHGTLIAGIASANTNNNLGVAGVGYNTKIINAKVLSRRGRGYYSWIADGIRWSADQGVEVINLSLGGRYHSQTLEDAIKYASSKGVVIVAAAGNNRNSRKFYPAAYDNVIAVAATTKRDRRASFSSYGDWVDLAAPGDDILSTRLDNRYREVSGTSAASPHVAAAAALVYSNLSSPTADQVRNILQQSADKIYGTGRYWQYGRLNLAAALNAPAPPASPDPSQGGSPSPPPTSSPTPTPTPTLTPSPSDQQTSFIYHKVRPRWSRSRKGKLYLDVSFKLGSNVDNSILFHEKGDSLGSWGPYRGSKKTYVYINRKRHKVNFTWNESKNSATLDFSTISTQLKQGDIIRLRFKLHNTLQGNHTLTSNITKGGTIIATDSQNFKL